MDDNETFHKSRRKIKIYRILIVLLLIGVCAFVVFRLSVKAKLRTRIDAIKAAGYPVTLAELNEWYTIPEGAENAADALIEAFLCYNKWGEKELKSLPIVGRAKLPARTEPLTLETKGLIAQYLTDNRQALELLHKGAQMEYSRYPVDLSLGFGTQIPYLSDIRRGVHLLDLEAVLHAENNEPQLAVRSVTSIFGIAHSLKKEPILISQLVCSACRGLAISTLEYIINRTEFTDEQLVELAQTISNAEEDSTISRAFAGERCMGISFLKDPVSLSSDFSGRKMLPAPVLELYKAIGLADLDAIIYLDNMNDFIDILQLPLHQRQRAGETFDAKLKATSKIFILMNEFMPAFSRTIAINIRSIAHLNTARVALAVQRYRLATGNLPDTLTDLVPTYLDAVPEDPFDGRSLRYDKLETGFVVYSVGEDRRDDGGRERLPFGERNKRPSAWDITFIVER